MTRLDSSVTPVSMEKTATNEVQSCTALTPRWVHGKHEAHHRNKPDDDDDDDGMTPY